MRKAKLVGKVFGRLTVKNLDHVRSKGRTFWKCECICGSSCIVSAAHLNSGHTSSCGCFMREQTSKSNFVDLSGMKFGNLTVLIHKGVGQGGKYKWECKCECGNNTIVYGDSLVQGLTKSCGCARQGQSEWSPAGEIYNFVKTMKPEAEFNVTLNSIGIKDTRMSIDIWVPSTKLAIEYHGLVWHSEKYRKRLDYEKYKICLNNGIKLIQIYEDEWRDKQEIIKAQLQDILAFEKKKRINPTFEIVKGKTPKEAREFLDAHHYLGAASGCVTIVAKHKEEIVGVWVFMKREEGVILWHRACWHPAYKAWNPHEKALNLALPELRSMGFKRMVTFSDNRFHTGELYERLGFKFEEEIPPSYYYTNGDIRVSKYNLRVPAGTNEKEAAAAKGWYRIWDSGKRRYTLQICEY